MNIIETPGRLRLKITLQWSEPPIWRRVEVNDDLTFFQLHRVIQQAMGWRECHLHEFTVAKTRIGSRSHDDLIMGIRDDLYPEKTTLLREMLGNRRKFRYWYDFGDDWWHEITIEKRLPPDVSAKPAVLLDGAMACPPEDCGGIPGYYALLDILKDPNHEDREDMLSWLGGDFDPQTFDLAARARKVASVIRGPRRTKTDTAL